MSTLTASRQTATMPQSAIRTHFHQALDIHRDFLAEIALDRAFPFDQIPEMIHFLLGKIAHFLFRVYLRPMKKRQSTGPPDAIDIGQPDGRPLSRW
jgi:hypothetical protein